jgi:hypothetical protein
VSPISIGIVIGKGVGQEEVLYCKEEELVTATFNSVFFVALYVL